MAQYHIFRFAISVSICYKIAWKKISAWKVQNYFQHHQDKAPNEQSERRGWHFQPLTTAVKMALSTHAQTNCNNIYLMHPTTVWAYIGQNTITIGELHYFWQIFEWVKHIVTSARRWVSFGCHQLSHRLVKVLDERSRKKIYLLQWLQIQHCLQTILNN